MSGQKHILVSPLNWGLGHASRCVPVIKYLQEINIKVSLAAEGRPAALLRAEFPHLPLFELPGYAISYPQKGSMALHMLKSVPNILAGIRSEHKALEKLIEEQKIDAVISDNRYGLYSKKVPCVLITHQLNIKSPWASAVLNRLNAGFISKFHRCWIPDYADITNISGDLGIPANPHEKYQYIGALSRFSPRSEPVIKDIDVLAVISGPEPQRTLFENQVLKECLNAEETVVIAAGKTDENSRWKKNNVTVYSSLDTRELQGMMQRAKLVLCRSGYSSIMDLAVTGNKAVFVPTPGQTEQEYLAGLHMERGNYFYMPQSKFNRKEMIDNFKLYPGIQIENRNHFKKVVLDFVELLNTLP